MVTHTLVFAFPDEMSEAERERFFTEGAALATGSGLVESYEYRRSISLSSDVTAPDFVASAMAQVRCADAETMRKYFAYPPLREFVRRWQREFPYRIVWVNTED
jgi:hypothetical protein